MFKIKFILPFLLLILLQSGVSQAQAVDQYPAPMCEDEYASRSVAGIDLTALENAIYPGVGANFSWFFDSGLTAPIPTPNNITVFNLSVFYVEVNDGAFTDTATVTYDVDSLPYVWKYGPPALCEDIPGGGYASGVDLTHFQQFINGCTSTQFTWFYDSLHTSPVLDPTNVIVYDSQYYYVELLNMFIPSNCTNKSDLQFFVNPTPNAFDQTYENCAETEQTYVDLSSYNNDVEGGVGNIIRWFDDINGMI